MVENKYHFHTLLVPVYVNTAFLMNHLVIGINSIKRVCNMNTCQATLRPASILGNTLFVLPSPSSKTLKAFKNEFFLYYLKRSFWEGSVDPHTESILNSLQTSLLLIRITHWKLLKTNQIVKRVLFHVHIHPTHFFQAAPSCPFYSFLLVKYLQRSVKQDSVPFFVSKEGSSCSQSNTAIPPPPLPAYTHFLLCCD